MAPRSARPAVTQLWQLPLFLLSLGLFGYAAWLFIDRRPGLTIDQKIQIARTYIQQDRAEASLEQLNKLINTERLDREHNAAVHLMVAESLELGQRQKKINVPANHLRIIEHTQMALAEGAKPAADLYRRMAESYEALGRPPEALAHYRQAMAMDVKHALRLQRKVIELQLAQGEYGAAEASIELYISKGVTDAERAWAIGEKAQLLMDRGLFVEARKLLGEAMKLEIDPVAQGQVNYRLGYCAWMLGNADEAERLLRVARDQLRTQHPLDAEACYVLGRIFQDKRDPQQANSFYQVVLVAHPDSRISPLARLGRGVCRIMHGDDDAGLSDLHDLVNQISQKSTKSPYQPETVAGLQQAEGLLAAKGNYQGAMEVLAYEQTLEPQPPSGFFARLAGVYERRADQLEQTIPDALAAEKIRRGQQVRALRCNAGDAYLAYSRALTLVDDKGYGQAMWRGIELYDRAGDIQRVTAALELFVQERPDDALTPDALLRMGKAYQVAGLFDKAIAAFQQNQFRYPKSLAASKSAVPLAQAYIAKGPESFGKAEKVLLSIVEDNPLITPQAEEFRQALFEMGQLFYRTGRYEEAVVRLEEWTKRYPQEERLGQILFLMADSYRKSAGLLDVHPAQASAADVSSAAADVAQAEVARKDRLSKARGMYDRVIELYRASAPQRDIEKLYLKLSHFYRADCLYDLGSYQEAIRLYDSAAFRYQDDPSALAAYVQIVNAYCALGKIDEAKTANERAKWLLRKMPTDSFQDGGFTMPKAYWEQWLKWTSEAGLW